uniref:Uncharacterized protein n=1 Tax=Rhizophora mucronata TaxID=61149 RepID=A0A2P2J854_RHIMU
MLCCIWPSPCLFRPCSSGREGWGCPCRCSLNWQASINTLFDNWKSSPVCCCS